MPVFKSDWSSSGRRDIPELTVSKASAEIKKRRAIKHASKSKFAVNFYSSGPVQVGP